MLRSCKYCGKIHDSKHICPNKPIRKRYKKTEEDKFRNTQAWKKKRNNIKERDKV